MSKVSKKIVLKGEVGKRHPSAECQLYGLTEDEILRALRKVTSKDYITMNAHEGDKIKVTIEFSGSGVYW